MKLFKTTALCAAVLAASSAHAELKALDDESLQNVTGQEGITIAVAAEIVNLDLAYTDKQVWKVGDTYTGRYWKPAAGGTPAGPATGTITVAADTKFVSDTGTEGAAIANTDASATLGIDGIKTDRLVLTQTIDVVKAIGTNGAVKESDLANSGTDAVLAMGIEGIKGTITIGAIRVGKTVKQAIGEHNNPYTVAANGNVAFTGGATNNDWNGKATSLGSFTIGNLVTNGGITQYIYAHK